ncbi:MAG: DNA polymerase/3'-5' exonuclease PolX [Planctomycetota bacterium]
MSNTELADIFNQIADLMELLGENRFRVNSYRKVSRILGDATEDLRQLAEQGRLRELEGIGEGTAGRIGQFFQTGRIDDHQQLLAQVPEHLPALLSLPGLGPKTVARLWKQGGITSLDQLRLAIHETPERLAEIHGLGKKKIQQIADSLAFVEASAGRIRLGAADELARRLIERIEEVDGIGRISPAGSLRRGKETIGDIDILVEAAGAAAEAAIEAHAGGQDVAKVLSRGPVKCFVLLEEGIEADLRVIEPDSYGAAMCYFTGSKDHNVALRQRAIKQGWKLNEYGLFDGETRIAGRDEEGIYEKLGLAWIPPQLREDRGEIQAAEAGQLPDLVQLSDIRGDLHMHTTASDGANSIAEMIAACRDRGYRYLCISDHSKSQVQANGLNEDRLKRHAEQIRRTAGDFPDMLVLVGIEVDIFKDGSLDFDDATLGQLDFVVGSPHSALSQKREEATARFLRAIECPYVHCIGHPSGRLIGRREGMELDIEAIAAAAAAHDTALEINASDSRLDLRDVHVRAAIAAGAKIIINTDAHSTFELEAMRYGILTAQRGWARPADILNTLTAPDLQAWLKQR